MPKSNTTRTDMATRADCADVLDALESLHLP